MEFVLLMNLFFLVSLHNDFFYETKASITSPQQKCHFIFCTPHAPPRPVSLIVVHGHLCTKLTADIPVFNLLSLKPFLGQVDLSSHFP